MRVDDTRYVLVQKRFLRGRQTLTLDGDGLKAEFRRGLSLQEYRFDLKGFLPEPVRVKNVPLASGVLSSISFILAVICWGVATQAGREEIFATLAVFGMVLMIVTFYATVKTCTGFTNVVLFQGPGGQMVLWPDLPDRKEFQAFLTALTARIRSADSHDQSLVRQLRQAGIIDDWQFDQAMELIREKDNHSEPET